MRPFISRWFTRARITLVLLLTGSTAAVSNWPQFRGPNALGVDTSVALPTTWDIESGRNLLWKTPVPGLAHASPIGWNDRIYLATAVGPAEAELKIGLYGDIESANDRGPHDWRLLAIDRASGRVLWNVLAHQATPRVQRHTKASHCNSTPATDGRRIVAIFGSEGLFCFDTEGNRLWHQDLGPMDAGFFRVPSAQWGFASSPVLHDGKVIVQCDVQTNSFLAAFDLNNGRQLWRTPRTDVPTWSTPAIIPSPERPQIIVNGWRHIGGYLLHDGSELWKLAGGGDIPVPTPLFGRGLIFQTSAHGASRPMRAIRPNASGDITPVDPGSTNAAIAWAHPRLGNYMQTPILLNDHLWACFDNGILTCFNADSGQVRFSERLPTAQGYTASPMSDGRHLYFPSETGNVYVVQANPATLSVVATNSLGSTCMASPAILRGALLVRTRDSLLAIGTP